MDPARRLADGALLGFDEPMIQEINEVEDPDCENESEEMEPLVAPRGLLHDRPVVAALLDAPALLLEALDLGINVLGVGVRLCLGVGRLGSVAYVRSSSCPAG